MQLLDRRQAQLPQPRTQLQHKRLILLERNERIPRELKVLPLLLNLFSLPINLLLLHRLDLFMKLNQLPRPDTSAVGVHARATLNNVKNGINTLCRSRDEAIFRFGVSSRNSLAGDLFASGRLDGERRLVNLM